MKWLRALFSRWTWLMAWRDTRSSRRRLLLFSSSISLGIAALVAIGSLGRNLEQAIQQQSKALLGADLVITARQPFSPEAEALISRLGGETARETSFSTMLVLTNGTRLVNARAISGGFPFYGQLETEPASAAAEFRAGQGLLIEEGVLQQFDAKPGDTVKLGAASFRILGALRKVPGDGVAFATIAPRLYLPGDDLPQTELLKGGSLARYRVHFRFPENADIEALTKPLEPEFTRLRLDFDTVKKRQKDLGEALGNLYRFLNLVALVALLLGAVGIASAIHVHVRQKLPNVAVLRCLGAPLADTFGIYLAQGLALGAIGSLAGVALGALVAQRLPALVASFVPFAFAPHFAWGAAIEATAAGFAICVLFALLPLLEVRRVSPLAAIRAAFEVGNEAGERGAVGKLRGWLVPRDPVRAVVIALIVLAVTAFAMAQTERPREGLAFAAGLAVAFALLAGVSKLVVWLARRLTPRSLPFVWRQGLASLHRPQNRTTLLLLSLGLGTFLILTLHLVRDTLLTQLFPPGNGAKPNAILFDIQPDQRDGVIALLQAQNLPVLDQAPIVTMRLKSIKGVATETLAQDKSKHIPEWVLRREYRSTWRTNLVDSEEIVAGKFVPVFSQSDEGNAGEKASKPESQSGQPAVSASDPLAHSLTGSLARVPVSVEDGIAKELQVGLGDDLIFDIQGVPVACRVASLRKVDWRQVRPNFFVVFPAGVLEDAPAMHVVATHVADSAESARMQRELVKAFPNVSAIDLTLVLQTLDGILTKVGFVIRFMALFTVVTGLIVLAGAIISGRWQRMQEAILLRTLGATRAQIRKILFAEYATLGLLAGITGAGLAVTASWALAKFAFKADYAFAPWPPVLAVAGVTVLTVLVGLITSRGIADQPPLEILRQEG